MSDVTIAPNASPPPAAPSNDVVINPTPVNPTTPVGSQAPDKPAETRETRPTSRREAIQQAFEKAQASRPKPKAAEAKIGHNQPPEETKVERAKPDPIDLRKPPSDQPQREPQPREQGRFAPRAPDNATGAQPASQPAQLPETAPYRAAPPRMTEKAKAEWHATPESVRGDVHRMHHEFSRAYERYRGDNEVMNTIRPFQEMAQQQGTTLERALSNYTQMEQKLRQDVVGGLDIIVSNLNLRAPDGQKLTLQDVAYHILNQSPDQHKLRQAQNAQTAQTQQIGQLHQMVQTLARGIGQMQYERKFSHTRSALDHYADNGKHPRFDELGDLIEQEIKLGFDLDTAYRRAELLRPATHAAQTRTTSAQTRSPDRSIHGAPDAGPSNGTRRANGKPVGRREAIASAIKRANGNAL